MDPQNPHLMHAAMEMAAFGFLSLLILVFIYPLILSWINRGVNGFRSPYWRSVGTVVLAFVITGLINFLITRGAHLQHHFWAALVIGFVIETLIGALLMKAFVRRPDHGPMAFSQTLRAYVLLAVLMAVVSMVSHPWVQSHADAVKQLRKQQSSSAPAASTATASSTALAAPTAASSAELPAAAGSAATSASVPPPASTAPMPPASSASSH